MKRIWYILIFVCNCSLFCKLVQCNVCKQRFESTTLSEYFRVQQTKKAAYVSHYHTVYMYNSNNDACFDSDHITASRTLLLHVFCHLSDSFLSHDQFMKVNIDCLHQKRFLFVNVFMIRTKYYFALTMLFIASSDSIVKFYVHVKYYSRQEKEYSYIERRQHTANQPLSQ